MVDGRAPGGSDPSLLRRLNSRQALRVLRDAGEVRTLAQLVAATGLSRPTLDASLEDLVAQGWVEELASAATAGRAGRPARRFRFRAEAGLVAGVDVGSHTVRLNLADLTGAVVGEAAADYDSDADLVAVVRGLVVDGLRRHGRGKADLRCVGLGAPGIVDDAGRVTRSVVVPALVGMPLARSLRRSLGCPVLVENDANLAALAEGRIGAARGASNVVSVLLGRRMAAGCLIAGRLYRGSSGAAGEIGAHPALRWTGAFERFSGHLDADALDDASVRDEVVQLVADAEAGQPAAVKAVTLFAEDVAQGLAALVLTLDPEVVVVGGGISRAGATVLGPLRDALAAACLTEPDVRLSRLGASAVVLGGVQLALEHVERNVLGVG